MSNIIVFVLSYSKHDEIMLKYILQNIFLPSDYINPKGTTFCDFACCFACCDGAMNNVYGQKCLLSVVWLTSHVGGVKFGAKFASVLLKPFLHLCNTDS